MIHYQYQYLNQHYSLMKTSLNMTEFIVHLTCQEHLYNVFIALYIRISFCHRNHYSSLLSSGDMRDDTNVDFLREFHLALSVVCNDLFFARYRSKNSPRDTASDRDGEGISTLEEPPLDPAQSKALIDAMFGGEQLETEKEDSLERLMDVKLLHGSDEDGVHFNKELLSER